MVEMIRHLFEINIVPVYFIYGQVFFVLGLAIALQSRHHSRLELARSLSWLAAFGIVHGFHEWGSIFIPIQASYVNETILDLLQLLQLFSLAGSFGFLFQFGGELFRHRWPRLAYAPILLVVLWSVIFVLPNLFSGVGQERWYQEADIWARYMIGFPGGILAALGLRYQAEQQIKPLNLASIYRMLRVAGLALGAYAILAGLIVPVGQFFPANWLNASRLIDWLGIPPPVLRSLAGLVITVSFIRAMEVFDVEVDRLIEQMQVEQSLTAERERISQELHDGVIQQVYTAGLLVESARKKTASDNALGRRLDRAMNVMNEAISGLRSYMGDLRPDPSQIPLVASLERQALDPRLTALMNVELSLNLSDDDCLNVVEKSRILAILSESLANAARHARARHVKVAAGQENGQFTLTVEDDGCGFDVSASHFGYGLRDMQDRARLLEGSLTIRSMPGQGTQIRLVVPSVER